METDWATGAYRDTGVVEMDWVTGSMFSGDPGVDISSDLISSHLIIQRLKHSIVPIFWSHLLFSRLHVDPRNCVDTHSRVVSYLLTLFLPSLSQNFAFSLIPFGKLQEVRRSVTIASLPSSSAVPPQMEPKRGFWFGKLSTEWCERPRLATTGKYGAKQPMKDTYPASEAQCRRK